MNAEQFAPYIKHTPEEIRGFFGSYRFLSNFHECKVVYDGMLFNNSEAAYQSAKTLYKNEKEMFVTMTGKEAKEAGRKISLRSDWEQIKDTVMFDILCHKFLFNEELADALRNTGTAYLEETNWWGDRYWGSDPTNPYDLLGVENRGQNQLGKILMMVRIAVQ